MLSIDSTSSESASGQLSVMATFARPWAREGAGIASASGPAASAPRRKRVRSLRIVPLRVWWNASPNLARTGRRVRPGDGDGGTARMRRSVASDAGCAYRFRLAPPAPVAQPDRASDFGSEGWGFESSRAHDPSSDDFDDTDDTSDANDMKPSPGVPRGRPGTPPPSARCPFDHRAASAPRVHCPARCGAVSTWGSGRSA